jgi:hypothetical protein
MLVVRHEEVPQAVGLGALADLDQDLRVGPAGIHRDLFVEGAQRLELVRIDVLVHERADTVAQLDDPRREVEVHAISLLGHVRPRRYY